MAGDEIVADWLGDVYCNNITTADTPQRLESASKRFRSVLIKNQHASYAAWIGKYNSDTATFIENALWIRERYELFHLEFVDIYELGCCDCGAGQFSSIRIIGINTY